MSCKVSNTSNTCRNKNCHTVKQSHCHWETVYDQLTPLTEYGEWLENWLISSPMSLEAQLSSLTIFRYRSFDMCIRTTIYGSFPVLFPIDIQMLCIANIDFLDDWSRKYNISEGVVHPCRVGDIRCRCTMNMSRCLPQINILLKYRDIFSGARGMLKSLRLITTRRNGGRIVAGGPGQVADAEKKNRSFTVIKSIAIEFVPENQVGMDVNTIIGDVVASRNSQSIELSK